MPESVLKCVKFGDIFEIVNTVKRVVYVYIYLNVYVNETEYHTNVHKRTLKSMNCFHLITFTRTGAFTV